MPHVRQEKSLFNIWNYGLPLATKEKTSKISRTLLDLINNKIS